MDQELYGYGAKFTVTDRLTKETHETIYMLCDGTSDSRGLFCLIDLHTGLCLSSNLVGEETHRISISRIEELTEGYILTPVKSKLAICS